VTAPEPDPQEDELTKDVVETASETATTVILLVCALD